jgi:hypothetical protein
MSKCARLTSLLAMLALLGCAAHQISITPDLQFIDRKTVTPIEKNVGYYISLVDREKQVITPGGSGNKVLYFPYKELEPALQKVLFKLFKNVKKFDSPLNFEEARANDISFVFIPNITTDSSSSLDSFLVWPPTDFTVNLNCKAFDRDGKLIWERRFVGIGKAAFDPFRYPHKKSDSSLSAKTANEGTFSESQFVGVGWASFLQDDSSLSAKRASEKAFTELQEELNKAPEFRN